MKKATSKAIALLLAMVMCIGMLAGCGKSGDDSKGNENANTPSQGGETGEVK